MKRSHHAHLLAPSLRGGLILAAVLATLAVAHYNRAFLLRRLGRYDDAARALTASLILRPNQPEALRNRALNLRQAGRYKEAINVYRMLKKQSTLAQGVEDAMKAMRMAHGAGAEARCLKVLGNRAEEGNPA